MTCDSVSKLIPLYFYAELPPDEEDRVEQHLHECQACAREMERQRSLAAALDIRHTEIPPRLLGDCRADLMAAIQGGAPRREPAKGPWTLFLEALGGTFAGMVRVRQPVGAMALIALGFVAARFTGVTPGHSGLTTAGLGPSDEVFSTVRSVQPDNGGRVQIAFDETHRKVVSGNMDDENIRRLLLAAAHEQNAAVRVESVDLLKGQAAEAEVRDALLNAVAHDSNDGVRLKALEGLKPFAADPAVSKTLAQVLLTDHNDAVRMQVVDLLVARRDDSTVGVLQNVVQREENNYVRLKCEKALKDMNASIGTF
ncbi:MAG TPA: HEAT repeat domain-containing protein [Bryobacteraceae bacterium]|nr:HEAT repeat domain-containing protein [Bryobacteraceae bacterium]